MRLAEFAVPGGHSSGDGEEAAGWLRQVGSGQRHGVCRLGIQEVLGSQPQRVNCYLWERTSDCGGGWNEKIN